MSVKNKNQPKKLLGFPLTPKQDALINYLLPSIGSCILFILLFSTEIGLISIYFKNDKEILAWISLFFVYLPPLGTYIIILKSPEQWPETKLVGTKNFVWFSRKTIQFLLFPISSLWRYAEKIFWSIEAVRSDTEDNRNEAISNAISPRMIELYFFLQAFLQSIPQILVQLNQLMRYSHKMDEEMAHAQFLSITFNMIKLSITITYYQRFKTQKLAGTRYPWYKSYKYKFDSSLNEVTLRKKTEGVRMIPQNDVDDEDGSGSVRRSSNFYLEPEIRGSYLPSYHSSFSRGKRTSKYSGKFSNKSSSSSSSQPDFNIRRVALIKGLPEDDLAGKLISLCWWCAFLSARFLAISAFQYFYPVQLTYILISHFVLTLSILSYDAKSDQVTRSKALFFVFICYVYLFAIIEFKIKFKKAKFIYYGFFVLVYSENFIMCLVWWYDGNMATIETDFWFKFIFYIIVSCSIASFASMIFYFSINKPDKIVVSQVVI